MRYFLKVAYNGLAFHGSQIQGETATVQGALNKALSILLRGEVSTFGASRTDEGVHALANFYHFDAEPLPENFLYQLNAILPYELAAEQLLVARNPEGNARFDAISRRYRYKLYTRKNPFLFQRACYYPYSIQPETLHATAATLSEYRDFEAFSKRNAQTFTFNCEILDAHWEFFDGEFHFVVEANRFLRGMVRALVGTQLNAGRGKFDVQGFRSIIEGKDCRRADFSVPGHGLYLEEIRYPEGYFLAD